MVKIFKNFKEKKAFKPEFGAEGEIHFLFLSFDTTGSVCILYVNVYV